MIDRRPKCRQPVGLRGKVKCPDDCVYLCTNLGDLRHNPSHGCISDRLVCHATLRVIFQVLKATGARLDFVRPYSLYHRRHLQSARRQAFEPCLASSSVSKKHVHGTDMNAVRREYVRRLHTLVDLTTSQSRNRQQHWPKMYGIHHLRSSV